MINSLDPDFVFFTGDLVNNYAWELKSWEHILKKNKSQERKIFCTWKS